MPVKSIALILVLALTSGCSSLKFWESDEADELAPAELVDIDNEVRIDKVWSRGVGASQEDLYSRLVPVLSDGVVYAADPKGRVWAIDAASGDEIWKQDLDRSLSGGVGVGGGIVAVADLEGRIFSLSAESGTLNWRRKIGHEVLSAPASNGEVIVVQTLDGFLLGLDAADGRERWRYRADIPNLTLRSATSPVMASSTVAAGFANGKVIALNPANGSLQWEARIALPKGRSELERMVDIAGSPVLKNDVVYITSYQGRAAALTRGTGRNLWFYDVSSYQPPGVGDRHVYVTQTDDELKALEINTGQPAWSNVQMRYRDLTAPAYANGYVAVGDAEGYLHVLSADDGRYLGRRKVDGDGLKIPLLSDGRLIYVLDNDGDLTAFEIGPDQ